MIVYDKLLNAKLVINRLGIFAFVRVSLAVLVPVPREYFFKVF